VTQRHISTTCNVASCVARVADAEWLRHCEGVRRSAPSIGQLGEWRSLCEGEWTGHLPPDLPNVDAPSSRSDLADLATSLSPADDEILVGSARPHTSTDQKFRTLDSYEEPLKYQSLPQSSSPRLAAPIQFPTTDDASDHSRGSEDRRASLDHFPSPPTHFPIPLVTSGTSPTKQQAQEVQPDFVRQSSSPSNYTMSLSRKASADDSLTLSRVDPYTRNSAAEQSSTMTNSTSDSRSGGMAQNFVAESTKSTSAQQPPVALPDALKDTSKDVSSHGQPASDETNFNEQEFGVQESAERVPVKAQTLNMPTTQTVQRSGSARRSGSIVAAMRNRFAQSVRLCPNLSCSILHAILDICPATVSNQKSD
jgi:hypothetical protein